MQKTQPPAHVPDEASMRQLGAELSSQLKKGDIVLLSGPLGAGKTTLVRGILEGLGYQHAVRSPTYNLIQTFETNPPVMHADLYRLQNTESLGLEDYYETHLCLIEWPEILESSLDMDEIWRIEITFEENARSVRINSPSDKRIL